MCVEDTKSRLSYYMPEKKKKVTWDYVLALTAESGIGKFV